MMRACRTRSRIALRSSSCFCARRPRWTWLEDYNCGGYALRTFDWVGFRFPHSHDNASQQVDAICAALPEWERCDCPQKFDTKHYDYVAFRWGERKGWNDYHFLRLWRNGTWHGKEGDGEIYRVKDVFAPWVRSDGLKLFHNHKLHSSFLIYLFFPSRI